MSLAPWFRLTRIRRRASQRYGVKSRNCPTPGDRWRGSSVDSFRSLRADVERNKARPGRGRRGECAANVTQPDSSFRAIPGRFGGVDGYELIQSLVFVRVGSE